MRQQCANRVTGRDASKAATGLLDVGAHGGFTNLENLGDLFRLVMARHQAKDLLLPVGQRSDAGHRIL